MWKYMQYTWYIVRHKWYVLREGLVLDVPIGQLLIHDLSKLSFTEFGPYARHFYGAGDSHYQTAWRHHLTHNRHHYQYWLVPRQPLAGVDQIPLPMPERFVREMVADWLAMARQKGESRTEWYAKKRDSILLHPRTRALVEALLAIDSPYADCDETIALDDSDEWSVEHLYPHRDVLDALEESAADWEAELRSIFRRKSEDS
jgi:hypothetical protein